MSSLSFAVLVLGFGFCSVLSADALDSFTGSITDCRVNTCLSEL